MTQEDTRPHDIGVTDTDPALCGLAVCRDVARHARRDRRVLVDGQGADRAALVHQNVTFHDDADPPPRLAPGDPARGIADVRRCTIRSSEG